MTIISRERFETDEDLVPLLKEDLPDSYWEILHSITAPYLIWPTIDSQIIQYMTQDILELTEKYARSDLRIAFLVCADPQTGIIEIIGKKKRV